MTLRAKILICVVFAGIMVWTSYLWIDLGVRTADRFTGTEGRMICVAVQELQELHGIMKLECTPAPPL